MPLNIPHCTGDLLTIDYLAPNVNTSKSEKQWFTSSSFACFLIWLATVVQYNQMFTIILNTDICFNNCSVVHMMSQHIKSICFTTYPYEL